MKWKPSLIIKTGNNMSNEFKNNPLASLLLGILIGIGATLLFQMIAGKVNNGGPNPAQQVGVASGLMSTQTGSYPQSNNEREVNTTYEKKQNKFERIQESENGTVMVTKSGKYHRPGCSGLSKAKNPKLVEIDDAINEGFEPCQRCNP